MSDAKRSESLIRFGAYEANLRTGELRKLGLKIRLPDQPFQVLSILLERPGEVVTREELRGKLWASDTFVDFDRGLNKAMNRLRDALGDSAENPRFIETLPKRGYRFIAALEGNGFSVGHTNVTSPEPSPVSAARPDVRPRSVGKLILAASVLAIAVALAFTFYRQPARPQQFFRSSLLPPPQVAFLPYSFAVSPDGSRLAFAAASADGKSWLWIRVLSAAGAHQLDGTEGASLPFWSPDGRYVGFFSESKLKTVDTAGGGVRVLADAPIPRGGTWNADGVIVFAPSIAEPLYRVATDGGKPVPATSVAQEGSSQSSSWPCFMPDGKHFLYSVQWTVPGEAGGSGIYAASLDSPEAKLVFPDIAGNVVFASGNLLSVRDGTLLAQPFDPVHLRATGAAVPIVEQELEAEPIFLQSGFSVAQNGALVFQSSTDFSSHLVWIDPSGRELAQIPHTGYRDPSLSPDGRLLAVSCDEARDGKHSICIYDLARDVSTRLTDGAYDEDPIWSRDGKEILYASRDKKVSYLYRAAIGRSSPPRVVLEGGRMVAWDWLQNGDLLFSKVGRGTADLSAYSESHHRVASLSGPGVEAQLSPNGKWMAEAGVMVRSFPNAEARIQISNGGSQPRWSRDGRQLFYIATDKKLMGVDFNPQNGTASAPRVLFQTRIIGVRPVGFQYDVASDGRFLINSLPSSSSPLTLITGWPGLRKR